MTTTADYRTVLRALDDYRTSVVTTIEQRRYEVEASDGTIVSVWVDQPVVKEGE